jgi:hypothetical protein
MFRGAIPKNVTRDYRMPTTSAPTNAKAAQNIRIFTVCVSVIAFLLGVYAAGSTAETKV